MRPINLYYPKKLSAGAGSINEFINDAGTRDITRIFILTFPEILSVLEPFFASLRKKGLILEIDKSIIREPAIEDFNRVLTVAKEFIPELVLGIGGGSVLDVAKLVAAQIDGTQTLEEITGINLLKERNTLLACMPTTSGTGSEVSPNAILLDEKEQLKKGIISPCLVPDMCYVDPELTLTVPPAVTAATGLDAFTHCLEAYVNKNAHPIVDLYALEGMELIYRSLLTAVKDGSNVDARNDLTLGSLYGGMCLGPVNTTAIHALAYPLGSEFHIAHGLSNALLLPFVMEFNMPAASVRYAKVAELLGVKRNESDKEMALAGIEKIRDLMAECKVPSTLSEISVPEDAIPRMAESAMKVQRLLVNNPRKVTLRDAIDIYTKAYK